MLLHFWKCSHQTVSKYELVTWMNTLNTKTYGNIYRVVTWLWKHLRGSDSVVFVCSSVFINISIEKSHWIKASRSLSWRARLQAQFFRLLRLLLPTTVLPAPEPGRVPVTVLWTYIWSKSVAKDSWSGLRFLPRLWPTQSQAPGSASACAERPWLA